MNKWLGRVLCAFAILLMAGMTVCAADAEDIKKNAVLQTNGDTDLYETPDTASNVAAALPAGTPVIVTEGAQNGWCRVQYQESAGYVQIAFLDYLGSETAMEDEFEHIREEGFLRFQEAENVKKRIASERIWGTLIVVLVIAIFGVGIVSAMKKDKRKRV